MRVQVSPNKNRTGLFRLTAVVCLSLTSFFFLIPHRSRLWASSAARHPNGGSSQNPAPVARIAALPQKPVNIQRVAVPIATPQPQTRVPDVKGQSLEEAASTLSKFRLRLGEVIIGNYRAAPGKVASQFPDANEIVNVGTGVKVWVASEPPAPPPPKQPPKNPEGSPSTGVALVEVPDLHSHLEKEAQLILERRRLRYGGAKRVVFAGERPGYIFDQSPRPGTKVPPGTFVRTAVAVSRSPQPTVSVPDLFHRTREDAAQLLQRAGLQVDFADISEESSEEQTGIILSQSPGAGLQVVRGTAVSFVLSRQIQHSLILRHNPASVVPGGPVTFTAALDPPFPGATFQFHFGDGPATGDLNEPQASHRYADDGDYTAFAIATLNGRQLVSNRVLLPVHSGPLDITLIPTPNHGTTRDSIAFHAAVKPPKTNAEYTFNFGDGSLPETSRSPNVTHTFGQPRTYSAWVTVHTVHERLPAGRPVHDHQFVSEPVELAIVAPPFPLRAILLGIASVLALGAGAFFLFRGRLRLDGPPPPPPELVIRVQTHAGLQRIETPAHTLSIASVQFRAVHSPGEQTLECRGPLWTRIEASHD